MNVTGCGRWLTSGRLPEGVVIGWMTSKGHQPFPIKSGGREDKNTCLEYIRLLTCDSEQGEVRTWRGDESSQGDSRALFECHHREHKIGRHTSFPCPIQTKGQDHPGANPGPGACHVASFYNKDYPSWKKKKRHEPPNEVLRASKKICWIRQICRYVFLCLLLGCICVYVHICLHPGFAQKYIHTRAYQSA